MRPNDADEFPGRDYFGLLPESWEVALAAGYQVVGASRVCTFQELVVVGVLRYPKCTLWVNALRAVLDELEKLLPKPPADFEFPACQNFLVFHQNSFRDV